jgi:hypothetical protein
MIESKIGKYIPHLILIICLWTLIVFVFNIDSQGYVPLDDCLRHCAKAVSGKPWSEILVVRPEYAGDHNFGWHKTLETVLKLKGGGVPELISFSVIFCFLSATAPLLLSRKRPEAWMIALLLLGILHFPLFYRLLLGRPYIITIGVTALLLEYWNRPTKANPLKLMACSTLLFTAATFTHGSFYLYVIPIIALLLAQQWKKALLLTPCLIVGILTGILLTGDASGFIQSQLLHLKMITQYPIEKRYLVTEFQPTYISKPMVLTASALLALRYLGKTKTLPLLKNPAFVLLVSMGILGHRNARFFVDFGTPAFCVWSSQEIEALFVKYIPTKSIKRIIWTGVICGAFLLTMTANINDRWDNNFSGCGRIFPKAEDPELLGWFPEKGGIFYNYRMGFFYNTFAANPHGNWRYALGFEPNIMPDENLTTFRTIQKAQTIESITPWINKLRPQDRLVIDSGQPNIKSLEWKQVYPGLWFGRLPHDNSNTNTVDSPPQ